MKMGKPAVVYLYKYGWPVVTYGEKEKPGPRLAGLLFSIHTVQSMFPHLRQNLSVLTVRFERRC
jgi:hypothetical protein